MRLQIEPLQLGKELVVVERKIRNGIRKLIVGDQRDFVRRPEATGNSHQALLYLVGRLDRKIVIDQNHRGQWERIGSKKSDLLLDVVAIDAEFVAAEVARWAPIVTLSGAKAE